MKTTFASPPLSLFSSPTLPPTMAFRELTCAWLFTHAEEHRKEQPNLWLQRQFITSHEQHTKQELRGIVSSFRPIIRPGQPHWMMVTRQHSKSFTRCTKSRCAEDEPSIHFLHFVREDGGGGGRFFQCPQPNWSPFPSGQHLSPHSHHEKAFSPAPGTKANSKRIHASSHVARNVQNETCTWEIQSLHPPPPQKKKPHPCQGKGGRCIYARGGGEIVGEQVITRWAKIDHSMSQNRPLHDEDDDGNSSSSQADWAWLSEV